MKAQGYGRIVVTTSSTGLYGNFGQTNYGAAKLSLVGFMNSLKLEGAKDNIKVNAICPVAATRMTEALMPPAVLEMLKPEFVSPAVAYLASRRRAHRHDHHAPRPACSPPPRSWRPTASIWAMAPAPTTSRRISAQIADWSHRQALRPGRRAEREILRARAGQAAAGLICRAPLKHQRHNIFAHCGEMTLAAQRSLPHALRMNDLALSVRTARPEDAADLARIYIESWQDTYAGIISHALLGAMSHKGHTARWQADHQARAHRRRAGGGRRHSTAPSACASLGAARDGGAGLRRRDLYALCRSGLPGPRRRAGRCWPAPSRPSRTASCAPA